MFCGNCGANVEGTNTCPRCGSPLNANNVPMQAPYNANPYQQPVQQRPAPQGNPTQVLVFGILGLALGLSTGIVGLIFSILGLVKANQYVATYGDIANQVRIGKRLAIGGLIASICIILLYVFIFAAAACAASSGNYHFSYSY